MESLVSTSRMLILKVNLCFYKESETVIIEVDTNEKKIVFLVGTKEIATGDLNTNFLLSFSSTDDLVLFTAYF